MVAIKQEVHKNQAVIPSMQNTPETTVFPSKESPEQGPQYASSQVSFQAPTTTSLLLFTDVEVKEVVGLNHRGQRHSRGSHRNTLAKTKGARATASREQPLNLL